MQLTTFIYIVQGIDLSDVTDHVKHIHDYD